MRCRRILFALNCLLVSGFPVFGMQKAVVTVENLHQFFDAAEKGLLPLLTVLLDYGVAINTLDSSRRTALHIAAEYDHIEIVKELLKRGINYNHQDMHGYSALMLAVANGNITVLRELLSCGADVNLQTLHGDTALLFALNCYNLSTTCGDAKIEMRLACHMDEQLADIDGSMPVATGTLQGNKKNVLLLLEKGYSAIAEMLIAHGADVRHTNIDGFTPLMIAAFNKNKKIILYLFAQGIFDTQRTNGGATALDLVTAQQDGVGIQYANEITELLETLGMQKLPVDRGIDKRDARGQTALIRAVRAEDLGEIEDVLAQNAHVDAVDCKRRSSLMYAVCSGNAVIVRRLIAHGARLDLTSNSGKSALAYAIQNAHLTIFLDLLRSGARTTTRIEREERLIYSKNVPPLRCCGTTYDCGNANNCPCCLINAYLLMIYNRDFLRLLRQPDLYLNSLPAGLPEKIMNFTIEENTLDHLSIPVIEQIASVVKELPL